MLEDGGDEYDFEYEEDDGDEADGVVDVENDYYTAKCPSPAAPACPKHPLTSPCSSTRRA